MRRSGLALLLAVGVLGILGVLGAAFVTLARLERRASQQRIYVAQAELLARSGLEDALARLTAGQIPSYGGEDWDGDGALSGFEKQQEVLAPGNLNGADCPARLGMRPSFFVDDGAGTPKCLSVEGRLRGLSGALASGAYALRVEDESAKINVNGGFLDKLDRDEDGTYDYQDPDVRKDLSDPKDTGRGWNFQLVRILDVLGSQPEVSVPGLGSKLLAGRPQGGYPTIQDVNAVAGKDLSTWLTVSSWADTQVIHPNGYASQGGQWALNDIKNGRSPLLLEEKGRPAVNLNAAPRAVLMALIQGLQGRSFQAPKHPTNYTIPAAMAGGISDALIAARSIAPFITRGSFAAFCDGLVPGVIHGFDGGADSGGNLSVADLLKANFDPNAQLMKNLPDQLMFRWLDKSDLVVYSTEGNLGPTGTFKVSAVGRLLDRQGRLLAEALARAEVQAFSFIRQTTQKDFVSGRLPDDSPTSYLSLSSDPMVRTTGAGAAWRTWGGGPDRGLAVITYPASMMAVRAGNAAEFDGCIGLASTEQRPTDLPGGALTFLNHFDDGWPADVGASKALVMGPYDALLQTDPRANPWPADGMEPGTLCPDGAHVQVGRSPGFGVQGNFPLPAATSDGTVPAHFVISYWCKGNTSFNDLTVPRIDVSINRVAANSASQTFMIGHKWMSWGVLMELGAYSSDAFLERQYFVSTTFAATNMGLSPDLRWHLVTTLVDAAQKPSPQDLFLSVQGMDMGILDDRSGTYPTWDISLAQDLLQPGLPLVLGHQAIVGSAEPNFTANAVLDEFGIFDFGSAGGVPLDLARQLSVQRWAGGRYYKQDDGSYLSGLLSPGSSGRLLRSWWTEYRPAENRQEIVTTSAIPPTGHPRLIDHNLDKAHLELELLDAGGTVSLQPLSQGGSILAGVLSGFRYRVHFHTGLAHPLDVPVLESPWFDDITFAWQDGTGPRIFAWGAP